MVISIVKIKEALVNLEAEGDVGIQHFDDAISSLQKAADALDHVTIHGRENADILLGCMLGIEMLIGKEEADG